MQCILTALKAESQPLINHFNLSRDTSFQFPVFKNNDIYLIGLGVGKKNIKNRIITFLNQNNPDLIQFINIGIAGGNSKSTKIGSSYLLHKIKDEATEKTYYPDILFKHNFEEISLVTVESIISDGGGVYKGLVDMEASEIFKICTTMVPVHRLAFLKIVSDYMNNEFEQNIAHPISKLISSQLIPIESFLSQFEKMFNGEIPILSENDIKWIDEMVQKMSLTETQYQQLLQFAKGFRLRKTGRPFPDVKNNLPMNKTTQKHHFKIICAQLSA